MKKNKTGLRGSKEYTALLNTSRWRAIRESYLCQHPMCEDCLLVGTLRVATLVHHKRPIETAPTKEQMEILAYNPDNLRALCHNCHVEAHRQLATNSKEQRAAYREKQKNRFVDKFLAEPET